MNINSPWYKKTHVYPSWYNQKEKPKVDLHTRSAAAWYGIFPSEVTPYQRAAMKLRFHAWNYSNTHITPFEKEAPKMKHSREDYVDAACEMYKDDLSVEITSHCETSKPEVHGTYVSAAIFITDEEVERRKGPFFVQGQRVYERSPSGNYEGLVASGMYPDYPCQKIADALNAQWRAEKEQS